MYNEILPSFIKKHKTLEANEQPVYQLLELFSKTNDKKPKSYRCAVKSHTTLFSEKFFSLNLEDFKFLITRCCWRVYYSHYRFEQAHFKKEFVLMNKRSIQNAKINQKRFLEINE